MSMKLLPKSEIDRKKAVEQRVAVEEGMKLARRVDGLREAAADTETAFKKYRDETIAKINEEIGQKSKERDGLDRQINLRKEELVKLQKPLDDEWAKVNQAATDLNRRTEESNVREHKLTDREGEVELKEKKVAATLARATTKEELSTSNLRTTAQAESAAQQALSSANRIKEEALALKASTEKELIHREELVANRENDATLKEQDLTTREKALADGWRLLEDRQALFERSIKRVNKTSNVN